MSTSLRKCERCGRGGPASCCNHHHKRNISSSMVANIANTSRTHLEHSRTIANILEPEMEDHPTGSHTSPSVAYYPCPCCQSFHYRMREGLHSPPTRSSLSPLKFLLCHSSFHFAHYIWDAHQHPPHSQTNQTATVGLAGETQLRGGGCNSLTTPSARPFHFHVFSPAVLLLSTPIYPSCVFLVFCVSFMFQSVASLHIVRITCTMFRCLFVARLLVARCRSLLIHANSLPFIRVRRCCRYRSTHAVHTCTCSGYSLHPYAVVTEINEKNRSR